MMTSLEAARAYLRAGCSVIPVGADKRPLIRWGEFQDRRSTEAGLAAWWRIWPEAGPAIVCGAVSELVVLDGDPRNGEGLAAVEARLPATPMAETGGGGRHFYFTIPSTSLVKKVPAILPGLDLQGEGSYVVAPPSCHPSGRRYRWLPGRALGEVPVAPLPALVRDLLALHRQLAARVPHGERPLAGALTVEGALSRLDGVRRAGAGWLARCPVHEDHEPSLSVGVAADGRVLLHCFAGCAFADVLHALLEGVPA